MLVPADKAVKLQQPMTLPVTTDHKTEPCASTDSASHWRGLHTERDLANDWDARGEPPGRTIAE
jgi:hypothetical protein